MKEKGLHIKWIIVALAIIMCSQITGSARAQSYTDPTVVLDVSCGGTYKYGDMIEVKVLVDNADSYKTYGEGTFKATEKSYKIKGGATGVTWHYTAKNGYEIPKGPEDFEAEPVTITAKPPKQCQEIVEIGAENIALKEIQTKNKNDLKNAEERLSQAKSDVVFWTIAAMGAGVEVFLKEKALNAAKGATQTAEGVYDQAVLEVAAFEARKAAIENEITKLDAELIALEINLANEEAKASKDEREIAILKGQISAKKKEIELKEDAKKIIEDDLKSAISWQNDKKTAYDLLKKAEELASAALTTAQNNQKNAIKEQRAAIISRKIASTDVKNAEAAIAKTKSNLDKLAKRLEAILKWFSDMGIDVAEACGH